MTNINPKDYRPAFLKDALEKEPLPTNTPRKCRKCPRILPPWLRYYCSGECIRDARMDGTYGKEDAPVF